MRKPLLQRLSDARTASCSCKTKTPNLTYHHSMCHYRLFNEARSRILELERELKQAKVNKPTAHYDTIPFTIPFIS